jgi:hypothetical protein
LIDGFESREGAGVAHSREGFDGGQGVLDMPIVCWLVSLARERPGTIPAGRRSSAVFLPSDHHFLALDRYRLRGTSRARPSWRRPERRPSRFHSRGAAPRSRSIAPAGAGMETFPSASVKYCRSNLNALSRRLPAGSEIRIETTTRKSANTWKSYEGRYYQGENFLRMAPARRLQNGTKPEYDKMRRSIHRVRPRYRSGVSILRYRIPWRQALPGGDIRTRLGRGRGACG